MSDKKRQKRFDRTSFHARVGTLDADTLRKILWNLYWPAPAALRERIEGALDPPSARRKHGDRDDIDAEELHAEALRFVALARSGAYIGGTREVSRQERSKWRLTCKRLVDEATILLSRDDFEHGAAAIAALIDLLSETRDYEYFRSEDPVAAARVVVSETVRALWATRLRRQGFAAFAKRAAPELIRWESAYGWTRSGQGPVARRETSLAVVLTSLLRVQDAWEAFADAYIKALDDLAPKPPPAGRRPARSTRLGSRDDWHRRYALEQRARNLAEWHALLLERLDVQEAARCLDCVASHPSLVGPEMDFMKARISHLRGDKREASKLISSCLARLPGHRDFIAFALEIGASLPRRSAEIARELKLPPVRSSPAK